MSRIDLIVPDLGGNSDVSVVDVLVKVGDSVEIDTPLVTLETDKASLDVPSTSAGTVAEIVLKRGDKVSKGSVIARLEQGAPATEKPGSAAVAPAQKGAPPQAAPAAAPPSPAAGNTAAAAARPPASSGPPAGSTAPAAPGTAKPAAAVPESAGDTVRMPIPDLAQVGGAEVEFNRSVQLLVLGTGPGGYTAAFRAADLGMQVAMVERWSNLGGVCLNVGCIPSKALLHAAKVIEDAHEMSERGITFGAPSINLPALRGWQQSVVKRLTGGLRVLSKQRKVEIVQGVGRFISPHVLEVMGSSGSERIRFDQCIIAAGSESVKLPGLPPDPRIMDSTDALTLPEFSGGLLVVGGGIIGLEMATVYNALGTRVSVVELTPQLMPGCDADLVRPLEKRIRAHYEQILLGTKVTRMEALDEGIRVTFEGEGAPAPTVFGRVLVSVGRVPNGKAIGAEAAGVKVSDRGYIPVDRQMRTNVPHIFAVGDIAAPPMLAHKAMHEAKVAAEVASGLKHSFDARVIPSVAYTDPEIAWAGLTEIEAKAKSIAYKKGLFPWAANGRSLSLGRDEGFTKLLFDPVSHRLLGGGIVGSNAGDLISEVALAIETGADAADIGLTIHPHPTLSETVAGAAEAFEGTLTDLYMPKKSA